MSLRIGDEAPNFQAHTTLGFIHFHAWIGDSYAVLFSHPKDFTPVCTTELGYMAKLEPEFKKRNTKVVGLSIDPVDDHKRVGPLEGGFAVHSQHLSPILRNTTALAARTVLREYITPCNTEARWHAEPNGFR